MGLSSSTKVIGLLFLLTASIQAQTISRIDISPTSQSLKIGDSVTATITAYDSANAIIPSPQVTFLPDVPNGISVVKLTATTARVTALAGGVWGVTAIGVGTVGTSQIPVRPLTPLIITVTAPTLFTNSLGRAIAMQSPLFTSEPFSTTSPNNLGSDPATRVMFFMGDVDLLPTDTQDMITAEGTDAAGTRYSLPLDSLPHKIVVGGLTMWQVIVKLPSNLPTGDLRVTVTWKGAKSNEGKIAISSPIAAVHVTTPLNDLSINPDAVVRDVLDNHAAWRLLEIPPTQGIEYDQNFFEQNWTTVNYVSSLYGLEFRILHHIGNEIWVNVLMGGFPHFQLVWGVPMTEMQTTGFNVADVPDSWWKGNDRAYYFNVDGQTSIYGQSSSDGQFFVMCKRDYLERPTT